MPVRRTRRQPCRWAVVASVLLVVLYFLVPVEPGITGTRLILRGIGTAVGVLVVSWLVLAQVRRNMAGVTDGNTRSLITLAVALVGGTLAFALADYVLEVSDSSQFTGLSTRIDALYFALATLTTIGYGDVHPQGQVARLVVCMQMLFSIGVLATGASLLFKQLSGRRAEGR